MAEILFSCPNCRQSVQCDTTLAGSHTRCPKCEQPVPVPTAPPSGVTPTRGTIQVKVSTLRTAAAIVLGLLVAAGLIMVAVHFLAGPKKLTFRAYVDGTDVIKLSGNKLWIEHQTWQLPARISINGKKWNPVWAGDTSMPCALNPVFWPHHPESVTISRRQGRGTITINQTPTPANNQTLGIVVDDGPYGGADWYEFTVSWK